MTPFASQVAAAAAAVVAERLAKARGEWQRWLLSVTLRIWSLLLVLSCAGVSGCERELRIPYIPPTLENWPQPYRGVAGLEVHVFVTGYLRVPEALLLRGGSLTRMRQLPVPAFVIRHPRQGLIVFNTGLAPGLKAEALPRRGLLGAFLQSQVDPGDGLRSQMREVGLQPEAVRWVVLSSMRFEHTGEVEKFPEAQVVVAKSEETHARRGAAGYRSADFDDVARWKFIDFADAPPVATFPAHIDLFGDKSCLLVDARGSTPGTMALLVSLRPQPLLLAGDLAPVQENVRYGVKPAVAFDMPQWWDHIWRLKRFKDLVPELIVVPGYDLQSLERDPARAVTLHPAPTPAVTPLPTATPDFLRRLLPQPM